MKQCEKARLAVQNLTACVFEDIRRVRIAVLTASWQPTKLKIRLPEIPRKRLLKDEKGENHDSHRIMVPQSSRFDSQTAPGVDFLKDVSSENTRLTGI